ncbi:hypothetical protein H8356DRAFT_1320756 [Neocallimastix lanati (nom. inval.)]|nr:hypothetical protein H8356DRAFT_1320756 [Neocallimastix sp. JGI-2020a]
MNKNVYSCNGKVLFDKNYKILIYIQINSLIIQIDSSNMQNNNTLNNYTFTEVSNDTIISNDFYDIPSYDIHNSNTKNPSQTNNNTLRKFQF